MPGNLEKQAQWQEGRENPAALRGPAGEEQTAARGDVGLGGSVEERVHRAAQRAQNR